MDEMQKELDATYPELNIQLIGINSWGHEDGVPGFTSGQDIPLLQDVDSDGDGQSDTQASWDVSFRDLVILNGSSSVVKVFNLTTYNLRDSANYAELRQLLIDTESCSAGDANRDGKFNSTDLIQVFIAAEYEDDIEGNSTWETGDWNYDGEFDTGDLVTAFQCATYVADAVADHSSEPFSDLGAVRSYIDSEPRDAANHEIDSAARDEYFRKWSIEDRVEKLRIVNNLSWT